MGKMVGTSIGKSISKICWYNGSTGGEGYEMCLSRLLDFITKTTEDPGIPEIWMIK